MPSLNAGYHLELYNSGISCLVLKSDKKIKKCNLLNRISILQINLLEEILCLLCMHVTRSITNNFLFGRVKYPLETW